MHITSFIAAVGFAFFPLLAHAGVTYQWVATNNQTPWGLSLQLEFDQQTVDSGFFDFDYEQTPGPNVTPQNGLLGIRYSNLSSQSTPLVYSAADGGFAGDTGFVSLALRFTPNGFLTGHIRTGDAYQHVELVSDRLIFTVVDANSDGPMTEAGCPEGGPCTGASGSLVRQAQAAADVPEPASLALLGIGALALARARRRGGA